MRNGELHAEGDGRVGRCSVARTRRQTAARGCESASRAAGGGASGLVRILVEAYVHEGGFGPKTQRGGCVEAGGQ